MKILLVAAANSTTGGGERHVADLMRWLPSAGFEVELVAPPGGDVNALADSLGIVSHAADIGSMSLRGLTAVRRAIVGVDPDLVHAHGSRAAFYARLADPRAGERTIYTVHGIHADKAGSALRRTTLLGAERALRRRTARFVCVCGSDVAKGDRLGILEEGRAVVVYNGVQTPVPVLPGGFRAELGLAVTEPLALSIGRMHEQKDHGTLLRAWALVHQRMPQAVLALVGGGPLAAEVRSLADSLGLEASVRFCPPRPDLGTAYADSDVFTLSSLWEGLPYVVLEALGSATPVVATAVDGIPEAVQQGVSGLLVPSADPEALASALVDLLGDLVRARAMGEAGREDVATRFSMPRMIEGLVAVYRDVLP